MSEYRVEMIERYKNGGWYWKYAGIDGWYSTAADGCGVWYHTPTETHQVVGTGDFRGCETKSGMRRAVQRLLDRGLNGNSLGWGLTHYVDLMI